MAVKVVLRKALPWLWMAAYAGLLFWLLDGDSAHTLIVDMPDGLAMSALVIGAVLMILWSALPRWRRLENSERILWTANLPSRIGSLVQAVVFPVLVLPSPATIGPWIERPDLARLAGLTVLLGLVAMFVSRGLRQAIGDGVSVGISGQGLQIGRRQLAWAQIQAIESGFADLKDGAAVVLADERIVLSPYQHGPTGRALAAAVERFSPGTAVREPQFQARFGIA